MKYKRNREREIYFNAQPQSQKNFLQYQQKKLKMKTGKMKKSQTQKNGN